MSYTNYIPTGDSAFKAGYTNIPNIVLHHEKLSPLAKLAFFYIKSRIGFPDWRFYVADIAKKLSVSKSTASKHLMELEQYGLIKRTPQRYKNGRFAYHKYEIVDQDYELFFRNEYIQSQQINPDPDNIYCF